METKISAEWARLKAVMLHKPGIETFFGLMEPETFLFERRFSFRQASYEHDLLRESFRCEGIEVNELKSIIIEEAMRDDHFKKNFIEKASQYGQFDGKQAHVKKAQDRLGQSIRKGVLDLEHAFDLIVLNPVVDLSQDVLEQGNARVTCREPLANLIFVRDQQAVGDQGVVFGRMSSPIRRRESELTELAFKALKSNIACSVTPDAIFEGGDFLPLGDFALIGVGPRTNMVAVEQILASGGVSCDQVGIVKWPRHPSLPEPDPQVCMHLDTYLNVAADGVAVGYEPLLANADTEIYGKTSSNPPEYEKIDEKKLRVYLKEKDFNFVDITCLEQLCYAANFLCIKDGYILSIDTEKISRERQAAMVEKVKDNPKKYMKLYEDMKSSLGKCKETGEFFPHKRQLRQYGVEHKHISLTNISGGYGAIHCLTCTLSRK